MPNAYNPYDPYSNVGKANIARRSEAQRVTAGKKDAAKKRATKAQEIAQAMTAAKNGSTGKPSYAYSPYNPYSNVGKANIAKRSEAQRVTAGKKDAAKKRATQAQEIAQAMTAAKNGSTGKFPLAKGLKAGTKPKAKSKDEIKAAVKSAAPKAGKNNRNPGINVSRKTYTAVKGDSLYGIAEKTLPKGKDLGSWFNAIKKMNAGRRLFAGTGVAIPSKSRPVSNGRER